jgi:tRNA (cmo5U34)-methyltransferase
MSHFDDSARVWDNNPIHWERSRAIARAMQPIIAQKEGLKALEYGAGTAILSFLINNHFSRIVLMDSSEEMVKVMHEKVSKSELNHLVPLRFDLEHHDFKDETFDIIFSQMVFHHVEKIENLVKRMFNILNPGGFLVIADLYPENGTFHDFDFKGHKGFDPAELGKTIEKSGFKNIEHNQCFVVRRESPNGTIREYPIFLLSASK